ncbi:mitochondrial 18 KDa protein-domain-containing protein [Amylocarpus encephaloides]|uniref:Mitochondrial fission process protein 1 n=1 Tax=Amylocarpus encephaloides TaxID=45428 RepID=A0A9P7YQS3_9HELO|nr:mitochondrial 18 KDa protein-domain-containing protein [Amylocarpus encephaloides]
MAGKDLDNRKPRGPAPTSLPAPEKLPAALQKIVDKDDADESFYDELYEGSAPQSTDSSIRYAAYTTRVRTALLSAQRYVAYTSDIGESFRPVAHLNLVRAAYGISWAYIAGDVAHEGYKAYCSNQRILHPELPRKAAPENYNDAQSQADMAAVAGETALVPGRVPPLNDWRTVMAQRGIFQSLASMGLPAFTIHSIVRYSGRALKRSKNVKIRTYGPIGLGLAAVPALPYLFDKPVEEAVEWIFHIGFETFGGKEAVGDLPSIGREHALNEENAKAKKIKEL